MTIITGIVKNTWEKEMKMVGYIIVNNDKMEINQENIAKVKSLIVEAQKKSEKIEQRKLWLNENLNPLQSA
jgi:hypothetical protein